MADYNWLIRDIDMLADYTADGYVSSVLEQAAKAIRKLSAVREVKRGKWLENKENPFCECSVCGKRWHYFYNDTENFKFCPDCGAEMRNEEADDERRL